MAPQMSTNKMKCSHCHAIVDYTALCSECCRHYDFSCAGISESDYRQLKKNWQCFRCKKSTAVTLDKLHDQLLNITGQLAPLGDLQEDVKTIISDIAEFKDSLRLAHSSIKGLSERIEYLESNMGKYEKLADAVPRLERELKLLSQDKHEKDQWMRINNVEIKGVPFKNGENLFDIVAQVGNFVECPVKKESINMISRVPTYQKDCQKSIIVSFTNRYVKEDFVMAMRKHKQMCSSLLGFSGSTRIYGNDHLTPYYKQLLTKAKSQQKSVNFQYIWVKHCRIWARKSQTSEVFNISSESDLQRIC